MDLLRGGLVLVALLGVFVLIFGGARRRPGRPGRAPFSGFRPAGSDQIGGVVLTVLAVLTVSQTTDVAEGALLGLFLAGLLSLALRLGLTGPTHLVMGGVGIVAAGVTAWRFMTDPSMSDLSRELRVLLVLLVVVTFVLTTLLFQRLRSISGLRALALFGLVDVAAFSASPGGIDLLSLDQARFVTLLVLNVALAAVLGYAASPFAVSATALLATAANIVLSLSEVSADQTGPALVAGCLVAATVARVVAR